MAVPAAMASSLTQTALSSPPLVGGRVVSARRSSPSPAFAIAPCWQSSQQSAACAVRAAGEESACSGERAVGRREAGAVAASAALAAALLALAPLPPPAEAKSLEERYAEETAAAIEKIRYTLSLDKADPGKPQAVASLKSASVDWVARYRREKKVAGKPSFSNMYSVFNAISGHYNSFGVGYPIPVKRKDRILQEVDDAEKALAKGR